MQDGDHTDIRSLHSGHKAIKDKYKVAIVAPNCFYYQADLFRQLAKHPRIDLTVYFCSEEGLHSRDVGRMFGANTDWGIGEALLQGYDSKFLKNYSPRPSYLHSLIGLMNWGIWSKIKESRPDGIVLMSWMNPTWWLAVLASLSFNIPYLLLTDANVHTERSMGSFKKWLRKLALGKVLFRNCSGFLCAGSRNRSLYKLYGVGDEKLFPFAYSSGYSDMFETSRRLKPKRRILRESLGIPQDRVVILYCGRLSAEKNPFHLLEAYEGLTIPNKALVFVGDGELKGALASQVQDHQLNHVYFSGFQDRNEVFKYYAVADVMVLPSERETWGMVVNEAMCFGLPVIVSDAVGAGEDMVVDGSNGFRYDCGDVETLIKHIDYIGGLPEVEREAMGQTSLKLIEEWSNRDLGLMMAQCLDSAYTSKSNPS